MNKKHVPYVVGALVVAIALFYGGMTYGQNQSAANTPSTQRNGANGGARGMRGRNGGGFISGDILSQDATSVTLKLNDGGSKIVILSAKTSVLKTTPGSLTDLALGERIMVTGATNSDGSMTAESIQIRPSLPPPPATK